MLVGAVAARRALRATGESDDPRLHDLLAQVAGGMGIHSAVRLRLGTARTMPMVVGVIRPTLVLPGDAPEWPADRLTAVLRHELAHVRRRDCLTQFLGRFAGAVHWFNPLAWFALHRLRVEQERACDDAALIAGDRPSAYAEHLVAVARALRPPRLAGLGAVAMARRSQLGRRVRAVLDGSRPRTAPGRAGTAFALAATCAVLVPLSALRVSRAAGDDSHDRPARKAPAEDAPSETRPAADRSARDPDEIELSVRLKELIQTETALDAAERELSRATADAPVGPPHSPEEWAKADPTMALLVKNRDVLQKQYDDVRQKYDADHPAVQEAGRLLATRLHDIRDRNMALASNYTLQPAGDGRDAELIPVGGKALREKIDRLRAAHKHQSDRIEELKQRMRQRRASAELIRARRQELLTMQRELQKAQETLLQAEQDLKAALADGTKFTSEDWARVDETMAKQVQMRNEVQLRIDSMVAQLGPQHPAVLKTREDLAAREAALAKAAQDLAARYVIRWKADGTGGVLVPKDLTGQREAVARAAALVQREEAKVKEMEAKGKAD